MIESVAVVFSLLSVIYTVRKSMWSWVYGLIGIIFYGILFYQTGLYSNLLLQGLFVFQSIYGMYNWKNNKENGIIITETINYEEVSVYSVITLSLYILLSSFIKSTTLDSLTTAISIVAFYLLGKRKIENWIFWIIADLIYIYMFFSQGLYLSSVLYLIFLILCIIGYKKWKV